MVNLRKKVIQYMSDLIANEILHEEISETFQKVDVFLKNYIKEGSKEDEKITGLLVDLEELCFKAGANMAFDLIAGKDVE